MMPHPDSSGQQDIPLTPPLNTREPDPTPAEARARAVLNTVCAWPEGQMVLTGPPRSGRSTLAADFARRTGAAFLSAPHETLALSMPELANGLVIDDADTPPAGDALLMALNLCRARSVPLLLVGRQTPSCWPSIIRDLQSRLDALPSVPIDPPCEQTLNLRLASACQRHFIRLPASAARYLIQHMPRDYSLIETLAEILAGLSAKRPLSPTLAREALARL